MPERSGMTQAWNGVEAALPLGWRLTALAGIPWPVRWLTLGAALMFITACSTQTPAMASAQPDEAPQPGQHFGFLLENRVDRPYTLVIAQDGRITSQAVIPPCSAGGGGGGLFAAEWSMRLYEGAHEGPQGRVSDADALAAKPPGEPIGSADSHEHPSFPVYLHIVIEPRPADFDPRARFDLVAEDPTPQFEVAPSPAREST